MVSSSQIFKNFKEHSIAEFFRKNKQMLGFSGKVRSLTTIVHEYLTNSLDACEEAQILPEVDLKLEQIDETIYKVSIKDNGPGIPRKHLGKALGQMLAGTKFHRYVQQRGQQGIGAAGCTLYAQLTTGKPIYVISYYDDQIIKCNISIDIRTNSPIISNEIIEENKEKLHGLYIEGIFGDVKYDKSSQGPFEYIKRTAIANPHLTVYFLEPTMERTTFSRSTDRIPQKPTEVLPHPLGLTVADLIEFAHTSKEKTLKSFFQSSFQRFSAAKVEEVQKLVNGTVSGIKFVDLLKSPTELTWEEGESLIKAFSKIKWTSPTSDCLSPIGPERIQTSIAHILAPDFIAVTERPFKIYKGGIPFMVEAAIAWGGHAGRTLSNSEVTYDIMRYANSAPLLFDSYACAITQAVKEIDWKRYQIKDIDHSPLTIFVNFVSVYVPYISTGKQAISPEEEIYQEIKYAIMDSARKLQLYISGVNRDKEIHTRKNIILRYIPQLSADLAELGESQSKEILEKKLKELLESKYFTKFLEENQDTKNNDLENKEEIQEEKEE